MFDRLRRLLALGSPRPPHVRLAALAFAVLQHQAYPIFYLHCSAPAYGWPNSHKAAVAALDRILLTGLSKGPIRGDMLETAFYHDSEYHYVIHKADGSKGEEKEARNAFWIRVLSLVPWQPEETKGNSESPQDNESNRDPKDKPRNLRPIFVLIVSMEDSASANNDPPLADGDVDLKFRHWLGVWRARL